MNPRVVSLQTDPTRARDRPGACSASRRLLHGPVLARRTPKPPRFLKMPPAPKRGSESHPQEIFFKKKGVFGHERWSDSSRLCSQERETSGVKSGACRLVFGWLPCPKGRGNQHETPAQWRRSGVQFQARTPTRIGGGGSHAPDGEALRRRRRRHDLRRHGVAPCLSAGLVALRATVRDVARSDAFAALFLPTMRRRRRRGSILGPP